MSFFPYPGGVEKHAYQYKHEPEDIHRLIIRHVDAADAENICQELQKSRGNNDPAIALSIENGLGNVGTQGDAKENDEEIGGWQTWTKRPLGCILIFESFRPRQSAAMVQGRWRQESDLCISPWRALTFKPRLRLTYSPACQTLINLL